MKEFSTNIRFNEQDKYKKAAFLGVHFSVERRYRFP